MAQFAVSDELFDGQTLRAASTAPYGGADVGECLAVARSVKAGDFGAWHDAWSAAADRAFGLAERAEASGCSETARLGFLRACTYYRTAGCVLIGRPVDPRLSTSIARQRNAFGRAIPHLNATVDVVTIPLDGCDMPAYFYRPPGDPGRRATVVLLNGYDGTVEETFFGNAQAALDRGYNVFAFDGPGQGSVLVDQGVPMRPDWENVVPPVLDWLVERPEVDVARIAVIGWSLGGYLAPRAASGEHRFAACIADSGPYDMFDSAMQRIPAPLRSQVPDGNRAVVGIVDGMMTSMMGKPSAGWGLRRGLYVHDVASPMAFLREARNYTLKGFAEQIQCPTLVCHGELDDVGASAPLLYDALTCPKELISFTAAEGAGDHCELGARQLYHARSFGWLDELLAPAELG